MHRRTVLTSTAAALAAAGLARPSLAQGTWPSRPITIVVPFAPGGGSDIVAKAIAPKMQAALGQPVTIDYRPGASGGTGAISVARSAPDGHTLVVAQNGTWSINHLLKPDVGYDPVADFTPITVANTTPYVLAVNPKTVEADDLIGLMLWLKQPGKRVSFTSAGPGLADHLAMELFKQSLRVQMTHAPENGAGPAIIAVAEGKVPLAFVGLGTARKPIQEGRLRPIMITSDKRSPLLPEVPTAIESGHRGFVVVVWQGIMAPANLPEPVHQRVHAAVAAALRDAEVTKGMESAGFTVVANTPKECATFHQLDIARWRRVVAAGGIAAG
jgi:tripartite-type tricarboxylate transporter receptor subunit TctC